MSFVPLRVHSHWSLLDGVASIDQIVDHAQALHLPAIALTDTHALYGVPDFVAHCRSAHIQPIIGAEFLVDRAHPTVRTARFGTPCGLYAWVPHVYRASTPLPQVMFTGTLDSRLGTVLRTFTTGRGNDGTTRYRKSTWNLL